MPKRGGAFTPGQPFLPFAELIGASSQPEPAAAAITFFLPRATKDALAESARLQGIPVSALLNSLALAYLDTLAKPAKPEKKKTGRGNKDQGAELKAIELLRMRHPQAVRLIDIAKWCGVTQPRAARIVDNLSGSLSNGDCPFLVYAEDDGSIGIFRDDETGI